MFLQFDDEVDQDYLAVSERGLLQKTQFPGMSRPTAKLIAEYEVKLAPKSPGADANLAVASPDALDDLLGIPRRAQLEQDLSKLFASAGEGAGTSVLFIDLDEFKPVNDTYGHEAGDEVLKKVSSIIGAICRGKGRVYRIGGDELIVLLANLDLGESTATAQRIHAAISQATFTLCPLKVSASIGVAAHPETTQDAKLLVQNADKAMYVAKASGGGVSPFNRDDGEGTAPSVSKPIAVRTDIQSRLDAAELWMSMTQGQYPSFVFLIENKSDDEVTIDSIALRCEKLFLCEPSAPLDEDELKLPAHTKKTITSWRPSSSPTSALQMKRPDLKDGQTIDIDIVVRGKILGRTKTFTHTILVTAIYGNHRFTQFAG